MAVPSRRRRSVSLKRENKKGYEHDVGQLAKALNGYPVSTKLAKPPTSIFTWLVVAKYDWLPGIHCVVGIQRFSVSAFQRFSVFWAWALKSMSGRKVFYFEDPSCGGRR